MTNSTCGALTAETGTQPWTGGEGDCPAASVSAQAGDIHSPGARSPLLSESGATGSWRGHRGNEGSALQGTWWAAQWRSRGRGSGQLPAADRPRDSPGSRSRPGRRAAVRRVLASPAGLPLLATPSLAPLQKAGGEQVAEASALPSLLIPGRQRGGSMPQVTFCIVEPHRAGRLELFRSPCWPGPLRPRWLARL